mgnify:CR=1 FL=1
MSNHKTVLLLLILISVVLSGCSFNRYQVPKDVDLIPVSQEAVKNLLANSKKNLPKNSLVVVSSFVNVDELRQTSSFGRIVSSQIATAFFNSGYRIRGMELPTELFVQNNSGLMQLSSKTKSVLKSYGASALVVGVFAPGRRTAYATLRMLDIETQEVISSTDFSVPMGEDARVLLKSRKTGTEMSGQ